MCVLYSVIGHTDHNSPFHLTTNGTLSSFCNTFNVMTVHQFTSTVSHHVKANAFMIFLPFLVFSFFHSFFHSLFHSFFLLFLYFSFFHFFVLSFILSFFFLLSFFHSCVFFSCFFTTFRAQNIFRQAMRSRVILFHVVPSSMKTQYEVMSAQNEPNTPQSNRVYFSQDSHRPADRPSLVLGFPSKSGQLPGLIHK